VAAWPFALRVADVAPRSDWNVHRDKPMLGAAVRIDYWLTLVLQYPGAAFLIWCGLNEKPQSSLGLAISN
jgi:hypothetical protein